MSLLYLILLLASMAGVALLDARHRLFLWARPLPATIVLATGTLFLLVWDLVGIANGIFFREANGISTGILMAPHLPIEEPVFLVFLVHLLMTGYCGLRRLLTREEGRRP